MPDKIKIGIIGQQPNGKALAEVIASKCKSFDNNDVPICNFSNVCTRYVKNVCHLNCVDYHPRPSK